MSKSLTLKQEQFLDTRINEVEAFPSKVVNALALCHGRDLWVVRDLMSLTKDQLRDIRNLGEKGVQKIEEVLAAHGLALPRSKSCLETKAAYQAHVSTMLSCTDGMKLCQRVHDRLAAKTDRDADEDMRLEVLTATLTGRDAR